MTSKGPDPTPRLEPGDRCECGIIIAYGELFHRDSPAHLKRMLAKAEMEAHPPYVMTVDDDGKATDVRLLMDSPTINPVRRVWQRLFGLG